jgi:hypothetical protein
MATELESALRSPDRNANRSALLIGLDPHLIDFSSPEFDAFPGMTAAMVMAGLDAAVEGMKALGYEAQHCLTDFGETAVEIVRAQLQRRHFDCVMIGAGVRTVPSNLSFSRSLLTLCMSTPHTPKSASTPSHRIRWRHCNVGCEIFRVTTGSTAEPQRRFIQRRVEPQISFGFPSSPWNLCPFSRRERTGITEHFFGRLMSEEDCADAGLGVGSGGRIDPGGCAASSAARCADAQEIDAERGSHRRICAGFWVRCRAASRRGRPGEPRGRGRRVMG